MHLCLQKEGRVYNKEFVLFNRSPLLVRQSKGLLRSLHKPFCVKLFILAQNCNASLKLRTT